ncbi:regulatory protein GemA [Alysiella crassa]|uniref:Mu-like prophage protein gp16 n=1 Tax=Alysiella crassa TaxID=153491 RepID=A0A376BTL3_9NEIS|nr:regulatory protein GemA [Alysiella crassa]UOP08049.1 regulatory protein GemA [Alysiella crassa]SSY80123.1 Mu-like prophage protein gp16 [Alysiella crassa]
MAKETNAQRKARLIRLIHIGKNEIKMPESEYRTLIANVSQGKTSSKLLNMAQLETVLRHMKAQGFQVAVTTTNGQVSQQDQSAQQRKIRSLWLELHEMGVVRSPAESALNAYCVKYGGENWQNDVITMRDLIERLKRWKARFE